MLSKHCACAVVLMSLMAASAAFAAARLTPLGDLPGGPFRSSASGVSADGSVVVGSSSYSSSATGIQAFLWTRDGGMVGLGDLPGGGSIYSWAKGVSNDGSVVVGAGVSASGQEAFRWTSGGGMVGLGYWPGGPGEEPFSAATGVSGDGSVVVGISQFDYRYGLEDFRWTNSGGMGDLGVLPIFYSYMLPYAASHDGSVVVGTLESTVGYEAFRWTSAGGLVGLGHPFGGSSGANGVNADGSVVVGFSSSASGTQASRWTSESGMVGLGSLPGHVYSEAWGVSGDGSIVVGISDSDNNFGFGEAFRWTSGGGMERLWDVLVDQGVDPAADGWTSFADASAVSADGRTIVGTGVRNGNSEAFAALIPLVFDLPGDFNFDGSVDAADYTIWRDGLGPIYTLADYDDWKSNFGRSFGVGSGAARSAGPLTPVVPEPSAFVLLISAAARLGLRQRRHINQVFQCSPTVPLSRRLRISSAGTEYTRCFVCTG